jgi:carbon-monoxide dehydrogenase medium subunit/xanthine dehydrogenase FAD-binding subunit
MQHLQYYKPSSLDDCLLALNQAGAFGMPYAGGTDVMIHLRERTEAIRAIRLLVDLSGLPELCGITLDETSRVHLGAMTTHTEAAHSPLLLKHAPFLSEAAKTVGSLQIRNSGTIGGNVCNGSPAADTVTPLVAMEATAHIKGVSGERYVPVEALYERGGGMALAPGEIVTEFIFPSFVDWRTAFLKLGRRKALAISRMNLAAALKITDGKIEDVRIAPGCVFRTPGRVKTAEQSLTGRTPSKELFEQAGRLAAGEMIQRTGVRWSTEYKKPVLEALTERSLMRAAGLNTEA